MDSERSICAHVSNDSCSMFILSRNVHFVFQKIGPITTFDIGLRRAIDCHPNNFNRWGGIHILYIYSTLFLQSTVVAFVTLIEHLRSGSSNSVYLRFRYVNNRKHEVTCTCTWSDFDSGNYCLY